MKTNLKSKLQLLLLPVFFMTLMFTSCSSDDDAAGEDFEAPTLFDVEVGLYGNGLGVVGADFHFNADVIATGLIESVSINIEQRSEETYADDWSFEIVWDQYQGVINAHVHQHFDIPLDAPKGTYDFIITVLDQNGVVLEEVRSVELIDEADFPEVNPHLNVFGIDKVDANGTGGFNNFYNNGEFRDENNITFYTNESIWSSVQIGGLKGDGIMYGLLIKKSHNHRPETVEDIDFSKVIVTEVVEHTGYEEVGVLRNSYNDNYNNHYIYGAQLEIGAAEDNNLPNPNPITGAKAWESGAYYYGVVYTNSSYLKSMSHYVEFNISVE